MSLIRKFLKLQTLPGTILGGTLKKAKATIKEPQREIGKSLITAGVVGGALAFPGAALAALKKGAAIVAKKPLTTLIGVPVAVGVLKESPTLAKKLTLVPKKSLEAGTALGKEIEKGQKPSIVEGLKKAGIVGGVAAAAAGGAIVTKKVREKLKKAPTLAGTPAVPAQISPDMPVLGAAEPVQTIKKPSPIKPMKITQNVNVQVKSRGNTYSRKIYKGALCCC